MPNTWKTSEDAARDITRIIGLDGTCKEELNADLIKGATPDSTEKAPYTFIDPRTGDEIDIRHSSTTDRFGRKGRVSRAGRGQLVEEYIQNSKFKDLQEQLRMNRPMGYRNDMIESYFTNHEEVEDAEEPLPAKSEENTPIVKGKSKKKSRNVLISSLLEKMNLNESVK